MDLSEVSGRYVMQASVSSSVLKEALLSDALKYLKLGCDWERAVGVCEQLITFYRDEMADFKKLSEILVSCFLLGSFFSALLPLLQ